MSERNNDDRPLNLPPEDGDDAEPEITLVDRPSLVDGEGCNFINDDEVALAEIKKMVESTLPEGSVQFRFLTKLDAKVSPEEMAEIKKRFLLARKVQEKEIVLLVLTAVLDQWIDFDNDQRKTMINEIVRMINHSATIGWLTFRFVMEQLFPAVEGYSPEVANFLVIRLYSAVMLSEAIKIVPPMNPAPMIEAVSALLFATRKYPVLLTLVVEMSSEGSGFSADILSALSRFASCEIDQLKKPKS